VLLSKEEDNNIYYSSLH